MDFLKYIFITHTICTYLYQNFFPVLDKDLRKKKQTKKRRWKSWKTETKWEHLNMNRKSEMI